MNYVPQKDGGPTPPSVAAPHDIEPPTPSKVPEGPVVVNNLFAEATTASAGTEAPDVDADPTPEDLAQARAELDAMLGREPRNAADCEKPRAPKFFLRVQPSDLLTNAEEFHLPVFGPPDGSYAAHLISWKSAERDPRLLTFIRQLHERGLLLNPVIFLECDFGWALTVDMPCEERLAQYRARIAHLKWICPWYVLVENFDEPLMRIATEHDLGVRHPDDPTRSVL
jgi:hypothetical protein